MSGHPQGEATEAGQRRPKRDSNLGRHRSLELRGQRAVPAPRGREVAVAVSGVRAGPGSVPPPSPSPAPPFGAPSGLPAPPGPRGGHQRSALPRPSGEGGQIRYKRPKAFTPPPPSPRGETPSPPPPHPRGGGGSSGLWPDPTWGGQEVSEESCRKCDSARPRPRVYPALLRPPPPLPPPPPPPPPPLLPPRAAPAASAPEPLLFRQQRRGPNPARPAREAASGLRTSGARASGRPAGLGGGCCAPSAANPVPPPLPARGPRPDAGYEPALAAAGEYAPARGGTSGRGRDGGRGTARGRLPGPVVQNPTPARGGYLGPLSVPPAPVVRDSPHLPGPVVQNPLADLPRPGLRLLESVQERSPFSASRDAPLLQSILQGPSTCASLRLSLIPGRPPRGRGGG
ncbi:basic salivary proline-rich protein 2-like [Vombatus ursinus]|uniref:basic salivary proline-rich protein 2-like n=1 Tax=Vombatus ursinus TaxID=29139 RepID=UPI000FFD2BC9|nr:basic salivary proline-rich protein 2-like [Vombatus ursinus]